jgi:fucose permease
MGPLFAMGGLGGATVPLLVGLTSTLSGQLRAGLLVPLAALLGMLTLQAFARRPRR